MSNSTFVYVIYIRTTPEKLWHALTTPGVMKTYWFGVWADTDWKRGSPWKLVLPDGRTADTGEIVESEPPKRLVIKWRNEFRPELKAEGYTRCTMEIAQDGDAVKLSITHEIDVGDSKTIAAVSTGWPKILSNLKSLLETGHSLPDATEQPKR
jgi:uncharacterized protein YndB with AHSA1/START domain